MSEPYRVPAVSSAIRVLADLANANETGASHAELARDTGISKSTMHNLLVTLEAEGFVRRDPRTRRYFLGGALIPLGAAAARAVRALTLAVERLPVLATRHRLSMAAVQITRDGEAQVIERAYPPKKVHVGIRLGSRYGPFDGAIGKCLLAGMDEEAARALVHGRPIPAHTDRTLTSPERLLEEIAVVREQGWGASIGELNSNIAVASLIRGRDGVPEAMLLAIGFPNELPAEDVPTIGAALREEADEISAHAGAPDRDGGPPLAGAVPIGIEEEKT